MNHYPHHVGDYATGTQSFTMAEHGAYRLLMDTYYASEKPIPADDVYAIARATTPADRKAVEKVLARKFEFRDGAYHHARIDAEIDAYKVRAETARVNGRGGGRKPRKNQVGSATDTETGTQTEPNGKLASSHKPVNQNPFKQAALRTPNVEEGGGPLAALASVCLRNRVNADGAKGLMYLRQFVADGVPEAMLEDAVLLARDRKPDPEVIPIAYLAPIVADLRAGIVTRRPELRGHDAIAQAIANIAAKESNAPH